MPACLVILSETLPTMHGNPFDSDSEDESLPENLDELIDKLQDEQNEDPGVITIVLSDEIVLPDELLLDEPKNEITLEGFIVTGAESDLVEIE